LSRHLREIDGFAILVKGAGLTVTLVISEAVFYADDDPVGSDMWLASCGDVRGRIAASGGIQIRRG